MRADRSASPPHRFDSAPSFRGSIRDPSPGPIAIGGFAFEDELSRSARWRGFGSLSLVVPRRTWLRRGDRVWQIDAEHDGAVELEPAPPVAPSPAIHGSIDDRAAWRERVTTALDAIASGTLRKVVLAREQTVLLSSDLDPRNVVRRLRDERPACTTFWVRRGNQSFVGSSPELLARVEGRTVEAVALAGTARARDAAAEVAAARALLECAKNADEHRLVVAEIHDALRAVCAELEVSERVVERVPEALHLATRFRGSLGEDLAGAVPGALEVAGLLHPTSAVCGLPRRPARALIAATESERGWYAGGIGWVDGSGNGEFSVALRCGLLEPGLATLWAGAGIVSGSQPDAEYDETTTKMQAMLRSLEARAGARERRRRQRRQRCSTRAARRSGGMTSFHRTSRRLSPSSMRSQAPACGTRCCRRVAVRLRWRSRSRSRRRCVTGSRSTSAAPASSRSAWRVVSASRWRCSAPPARRRRTCCRRSPRHRSRARRSWSSPRIGRPSCAGSAPPRPSTRSISMAATFAGAPTHLPPTDDVDLVRYYRALASRAVAVARRAPAGPVHLNLPLREPLVPADAWPSRPTATGASEGTGAPAVRVVEARGEAPAAALDELAERLAAEEQGVIVCGPLAEVEGAAADLAALASRLGWPLLADPLSGARFDPRTRDAQADAYDFLLRDVAFASSHRPRAVLRFGGAPVSKALGQLLAEGAPTHVVVTPPGTWPDPWHVATDIVHADASSVVRGLLDRVPARATGTWQRTWIAASRAVRRAIDARLAGEAELFEGKVAAELLERLPGRSAPPRRQQHARPRPRHLRSRNRSVARDRLQSRRQRDRRRAVDRARCGGGVGRAGRAPGG